MSKTFSFKLEATSARARAGMIETPHGDVQTPVFMPVGTAASVKALDADDLRGIGAEIILGNTYHLYLRPGAEVIAAAGGLARFNGWRAPTLTDSGGFQVFSLKSLRRITEEGVEFRSNIDGSAHMFTPQRTIDIQRRIGADIIMPLDVCIEYPTTEREASEAERQTYRWEIIARKYWESDRRQQTLFGIIQGSVFPQLRRRAAESIIELDFPGHAIGGLSVGEPKAEMLPILELLDSILPENKPRYLMGVGTPLDLIDGIARGIDMFDCVMPTRNARNGTVFSRFGQMTIKSARYTHDFRPIDEECKCPCCHSYSRSYLRHLVNIGEIAGMRLLTIHNLWFYLNLIRQARNSIRADCFEQFRKDFVTEYKSSTNNVDTVEET